MYPSNCCSGGLIGRTSVTIEKTSVEEELSAIRILHVACTSTAADNSVGNGCIVYETAVRHVAAAFGHRYTTLAPAIGVVLAV